jgi:hypothetical protein
METRRFIGSQAVFLQWIIRMQEQFGVLSFAQTSVRKGRKCEITTQNWGTTVPKREFFHPKTGLTGRAKFFIPNNKRWDFIRLLNRCLAKDGALPAEHLLNLRVRMRVFRCNCEVPNANKTNENRSVRTGQGELANRRHSITNNSENNSSSVEPYTSKGLPTSTAAPRFMPRRSLYLVQETEYNVQQNQHA